MNKGLKEIVKIEKNKNNEYRFRVKGKENELLIALSSFVEGLLECGIDEKMIDIAVKLGKSKFKGKEKEFMAKILLERIQKAVSEKKKEERK